jgi:hypothetical protein
MQGPHVLGPMYQLQSLPKVETQDLASSACTCCGQSAVQVVLRRPIFQTYSTFQAHRRGCPFWTAACLRTNITFGLILCYLVLGIKWRMILALSIGTRPFSIVPSLRCYRAVNAASSPAFVSVATIIGSQMNAQSIPSLVQDLHKIFETRRASPDDRLPNGQTLLHVRVPQHSADQLIDHSCKVLMWPTRSANLDYQREPAAALSIFAPGHLQLHRQPQCI